MIINGIMKAIGTKIGGMGKAMSVLVVVIFIKENMKVERYVGEVSIHG